MTPGEKVTILYYGFDNTIIFNVYNLIQLINYSNTDWYIRKTKYNILMTDTFEKKYLHTYK